jgi:hypothetical protein
MLEPSILPRTATEGKPPSSEQRTLDDLDAELVKLRRYLRPDKPIPAEVLAWSGVDELAALAMEYTGRPLDADFLSVWMIPRIARRGVRDFGAVTLARAAALFREVEDQSCVLCQKRHPELGCVCYTCRKEADARHRETVAYLIMWASCVRAKSQSEEAFADEVGPEIRHLATKKFGHATFSMDTWKRVVDWLIAEHKGEGKLEDMQRSRVVDLLREGESKRAADGPVSEPEADAPAVVRPVVSTKRKLTDALGRAVGYSDYIDRQAEAKKLRFDRLGDRTYAVVMTDPGTGRDDPIRTERLRENLDDLTAKLVARHPVV